MFYPAWSSLPQKQNRLSMFDYKLFLHSMSNNWTKKISAESSGISVNCFSTLITELDPRLTESHAWKSIEGGG